MPTKDELLFENQSLKEDQEILLKQAQEAEQTRERTQAESELLRAEIKEAQIEKEQAEALAEQLQERLSQSPQPEEVELLKERLQTALSAVRSTRKTLEQRMARLELAREQDRREVKESFTWIVETIEEGQRALKEALSPPRKLPPPQKKIITPRVASPYQVRPAQPEVKEHELTIREMNAVAERALAWDRTEETYWERQERIEREIALQNRETLRYLKLFLIRALVTCGLAMLLNYLLGQTRFLILLSMIGASISCGLSRKVFRSLVCSAKEWDEKSRGMRTIPIRAYLKAVGGGAILSLLTWTSLALLAYGASLTEGDRSLAVLTLWALMILYVLSGAWTKSVCKAVYSTLT